MYITVQSENKKLAEPLRKAKEQLLELQRQLGSQEKEKSALISAQAKLKASQKKVENLSWEVEVLQQKYDRALRKCCHQIGFFDHQKLPNLQKCQIFQVSATRSIPSSVQPSLKCSKNPA